ncbi:MAG: Na+/H+ antiporter NhaA, partial [Bdellovibrionales bacterium]|nr:Na+/H+ antiporter NhaA [Bdellovibrionales bacterium]
AGWGIPMATDIAFAVGILTLFSRKVPFTLKIFLLALAIVDDLGAILVIAFFYTEQIHQVALGMAAVGIAVITIMKYSGVRQIALYSVVGFLVWIAILKSGVHATISGVIMGLLTPVAALFPKKELPHKFRNLANDIAESIEKEKDEKELSHTTVEKIHDLHTVTVESSSPLDRLIHMLHPFVSFFIMPVFAFVNAGVHIADISISSFLSNSISLGIILGLVIGKPIGVTLFSFIAIKLKLAKLPQGVTWGHMIAVGFLAGIGFTMALFISNLALKGPEYEMFSKLGILTASVIAGVIGSIFLIISKDPPKEAK